MIDHIGIAVTDFRKAGAFYDAALAPLGVGLVKLLTAEQTGEHEAAGYGADGKPLFWMGENTEAPHAHVAFVAKDHAAVRAFHAAALAAGGADNGAPGPRTHYHPDHYGAFVLDPDDHHIEAVRRLPA